MASTIGYRGYLLTVRKKSEPTLVDLDSRALPVNLRKTIVQFVTKYTSERIKDDERERSGYFEEKISDGNGASSGIVHYGTFGFESNIIDSQTNKPSYKRKVSDTEEIPLFYEFWFTPKKRIALAGFQSFAGRSCITLVLDKLKAHFDAANPDFLLHYQKLMPNDAKGSLYGAAPVKRLRLIKRNASPDVTDRYLGGGAPDSADLEVTISARRNGSLGSFGDVASSVGGADGGIAMHDGIAFTEAVAEIRIGKKIRPVGVFGSDTNAGVIDITADITRGESGHPTFNSVSDASDDILSDLFKIISG